MSNHLSYNVAGLKFRIHSFNIDLLNSVLTSFIPFRINNYDDLSNHLFDLYLNKDISLEGDKIYNFDWEGTLCDIYRSDKCYYIVLMFPNNTTEILKTDFNWTNIQTTVTEDSLYSKMALDLFLMFCYCFSSVEYNTLLIHASVIVYKNKAMIFQGKSGTGKSTHASLWLKHIENCFLLNDDNPVIRITETGDAIVYGSPWSGKTQCYINENYAIGGFVRLSQAPVNKLSKLGYAHSFASILPSCSNMIWDKRVHSRICETITKISVLVKCFSMECLPDEEAVNITKSIIE